MKKIFDLNPNILQLKESATLAINQKARQLRSEGEEIYHYGFGQSPFPVHPKIQDELKKYSYCKDYLATAGLKELREAIAGYLDRELSQKFDPDFILIGPGSKELIFQALFVFEGPVLIPAPSWVSYKPQVDIKRSNTKIIMTQKENNYKLQAKELDQFCQGLYANQKILIINNPNNPTGAMYFDEEVKELAEVCKQHNIVLISDEIYSQINFTDREFVGFTKYYPEATIVTGGLSKVFSAGGYRLGFMALPKTMTDVLPPLKALFSETFSSVCAPVQYAAVKAYEGDKEIMEYVRTCSHIHQAAGQYLHDRFMQMNVHCSIPQGSFYVFVDFEYYRDAFRKTNITTNSQLADFLLEKAKIAMLPGIDFYYPESTLTCRVATVDYDGEKVYVQAQKTERIDKEFIEKFCPHLKNGMDKLETFLKSLISL